MEKESAPFTRRSIFREAAIKHYVQGRDKDVLPRFVSPPVFLFLWALLSLCVIAGLLAWNTRIPIYAPGIGMVTQDRPSGQMVAILFLVPGQQPKVRPGQPIQAQIGTTGPRLQWTVTSVEPTLLSPEEAHHRYHLDNALSLLVTQPSVVIEVALDAGAVSPIYAGSLVHAQVQVGSQRVLALVPIVDKMIGA